MITVRRQSPIRLIRSGGFTIIELMIATVIFSMVLLLLSTGVINFTKAYYKGITSTNTQNVARSILDTVTQTIQFNGAGYTSVTSGGGWQGFCFGDEAYVYQLGQQLVDGTPDSSKHQTKQALLKGTMPGGCAGIAASALAATLPSTEELLTPQMRLADLEVVPLPNGVYSLTVNVAYGDDDLLSGPTSTTPSCKDQSGSQFCAISALSTVVQKRIQQ